MRTTTPTLTEFQPEAQAWHGPSLPADHYVLPIPDDCLAELDRVLVELRKAPVPTLLLAPEHFALDRCTALVAAAAQRLDHGPDLVILDRLPLERLSRAEAIDLYWILASMLEPPVAQEWKGTVIYDVRHDGQAYGEDTRGALTLVGLEMHTDSSMGEAPPNYLGLLTLVTARASDEPSGRRRPVKTRDGQPAWNALHWPVPNTERDSRFGISEQRGVPDGARLGDVRGLRPRLRRG